MYLVNGNKIWYPGIFPGHDTNIREQIGGTILQVTWCYLKFEKILPRIGM